jgi:hypothetical protein
MKRVLIYKGEDNFVIWDASTEALLKNAYLSLFNHFDKVQEFYSDINEGELFLEEESLKKKEALRDTPTDHPLYREAMRATAELGRDKDELEGRQIQLWLLGKARAGDDAAAKKILNRRKDYEYENWDVYDVEE